MSAFSSSGARTEAEKRDFGQTDWLALEEQLARTRTILHDILAHLQGVLHNLKSARVTYRSTMKPGHARPAEASGPRPAASGFAGQAGQAGPGGARPAGFGAAPEAKAKPRFSHVRTERPSAERFKSRPQPSPFAQRPRPQAAEPGSAGSESRTAFGRTTFTRTAAGQTRPDGPGGSAGSGGHDGQAGQSAQAGPRARTGQAGYESQAGPRPQAEQAGQTGRERPASDKTAGQRSASRPGAGEKRAEEASRPGFGSARQAFTKAESSRQATRQATSASPGDRRRFDRARQDRGRAAARAGEMTLKCAYDILCLDYPCSPDDIKNAYRSMARMFHPDLGGDEEAMKDINVAYEHAMRFCSGPRRSGSSWSM